MSCQSLSLAPGEPDPLPGYHRSVHFSGDGERKSMECSLDYQTDDNDTSGWSAWSGAMSRSAPAGLPAPPQGPTARFPRLEECAHFHYGRVRLGGLTVRAAPNATPPQHEEDAGWVTVSVRPHCDQGGSESEDPDRSATAVSDQDPDCAEWMVTRSAENFKMLDTMLHRCIYDRKVSGLPDLSAEVDEAREMGPEAYTALIADYLHHFSIIADDTINCGPILNWLQMDNKGHRLLVASEDSNSINTPAVAAAYSVRRYVSQARDEISFEVGDMISVIDMPGPSESTWWRGKRGFRVGFFPQQCVAVIGDKVPRNMKQPPPIVGSVAVAPIKPVLRKHGKLISLFRSFILSRPSRRALRQQGILRERVFGCDLGEHLLNSGHEVPLVLSCCAAIIEQHGCVDGIYRLSGASSTTQRLRIAFDEERLPAQDQAPQDVHAVASLLKMYFRELPNPLCTYQLYSCFVNAMQGSPVESADGSGEQAKPRRLDDAEKLLRMRETVVKLPPPHYRTLAFLMRHLHHMSLLGASTGMTARNMAIVWAPNLLRSPIQQHALQGVAVQAVVTEFLICYAELIFCTDGQPVPQPGFDDQDSGEPGLSVEGQGRRPKSLPLQTPTKLLSLEEARNKQQLRPSVSREPHYIEVGGGPNSLPRYHTIIQLPSGSAKRGLKRSPSGWRGLFFRASKHRPPPAPSTNQEVASHPVVDDIVLRRVGAVDDNVASEDCKEDKDDSMVVEDNRAARSCESLLSEGDSLPPLAAQPETLTANHHNRSVSCDSYFEASLAELAGMRLRLTSQEREMDIFSEDDTTRQIWNREEGSSADTSADPSPTKLPRTAVSKSSPDTRKRTKLEEQLSDLLYIDCSTPEHGRARAEDAGGPADSPDNDGDAKRICKEQKSTVANSQGASPQQGVTVKVKMRERGSPRKPGKSSSNRHSHCGTPPSPKPATAPQRHSTLIRVDWPNTDALQPHSLDCYAYSQLQSDSETSLPIGESRDSLAKRLIESRESLMSRSNDQETMFASNILTHMTTQDERAEDSLIEESNHGSCEFAGDMKSDESAEVLIGIVTKDVSNDNLDGLTHYFDKIEESNWSDGVMSSSTDKSMTSSDLEKSFEKKHRVKCDYDENTPVDSTVRCKRSADVSSSDDVHYDDVENETKLTAKEETNFDLERENRCNVTVTANQDTLSNVMVDSLEESLSPVNISYQNLNRLSNLSGDSGKINISKDSTPTYEQERTEEIYECFTFARPSYIHLASSSGGSNTPTTPPQIKSPIKSTISITYKSPVKENTLNKNLGDTDDILVVNDETVTSDDGAYEVVQTIGETAEVPRTWDASLPTQQAFQPNRSVDDLILLETPVDDVCALVEKKSDEEVDIYNQVKFFRQSINEVNSLILTPEDNQFADSLEPNADENLPNVENKKCHNSLEDCDDKSLGSWYENVCFKQDNVSNQSPQHAYENVVVPNMQKSDMSDGEPPGQVKSPLTGRCLDRRLKASEARSKNVYENYKVPFSEKIECITNKQNQDDLSSSLVMFEGVRTSPKLSLGDFNKENTVDNGNLPSPDEKTKLRRSSTNVRQLAHKFESPTENKGPFCFDRLSRTNLSQTEKMSTLERKTDLANHPFDRSKAASLCEGRNTSATTKVVPCLRARNNKLAKHSTNTRSLDENAFVKEFGRQILHRDHTSEREIAEEVFTVSERRKSLEASHPKSLNQPKRLPDLNLNVECEAICANRESLSLNLTDYNTERSLGEEDTSQHFVNRLASITPTTENKISLVQARLSPKKSQRVKGSNNLSDSQKDLCDALSSEMSSDKKDKLSRERIEKYKEERRLFLREKYSPHSFRGIGDLQLTYKNKEQTEEYDDVTFEGVQLRNPGKLLERRNTADAVQRSKFSVVLNSSKSNEKGFEKTEENDENKITIKEETPKVTIVQRKMSLGTDQSQAPQRLGASWDGPKYGKASPLLTRTSEEVTKLVRPKVLGIFNSTDDKPADVSKPEVVSSSSVRKEKRSPSFNIRDMAAKFEQKSNQPN